MDCKIKVKNSLKYIYNVAIFQYVKFLMLYTLVFMVYKNSLEKFELTQFCYFYFVLEVYVNEVEDEQII